MPIIDFGEVPGIDPIPEGVYQAEIAHAEDAVSKSGNDKIALRWKVTSGEYTDRVIFHDLSFHPNALWRTKQVLLAIGYDAKFSGEIDTEGLLGQTAELIVNIRQSEEVNPDTGEPYDPQNNVVRVRPSGATLETIVGGKKGRK
jgi:hypothetical protein